MLHPAHTVPTNLATEPRASLLPLPRSTRTRSSTHLRPRGAPWAAAGKPSPVTVNRYHVKTIKELHDLAEDDERWGAKFKVLKENLDHHISEEEGPMFRLARGLFSRQELQALGAQMMKMKAQAESGR